MQMRRPAAMCYAAGACGVRLASRRVASDPALSAVGRGRDGAGWDGIDGGRADIGDADQHDGLVLRPEGVRF